MIRKLMASSAVIALMSAGAITATQAQTDPAKPAFVDNVSTIEEEASKADAPVLAASEEVLTPEQPTLASVYIGRSVFSSAAPESDTIGDVNDLIVGEDGAITHAVVGVGGFLGIGEKDVAVPFDELEVVERDGDIRLIYAATRDQLDAAPALDRTAYDPMARFQEEQAASTDTGGGALAPAATDLTAAPAPDAVTLPAEEDTAAAPADATTPQAEPGEGMAAADTTPAEPSDDVAAVSDVNAAAPAEPSQDMAAAPADATPLPAEEDVAATAETDSALTPASGDLGFVTASADQIQASELMGKAVYGADNESIGEISDLVLEKEGTTRVALIDIGGFLGVGEKTVGIPFDQLQISKAEDGSEQVKVALSKQQLEQLPATEIETAAATDATAPAIPAAPADLAAAPAESSVTTEAPADTALAPSTEEMTTGSISQPVDFALATQDIAASKLIGATVYGPDDANLGEVSDLVFSKTGEIDAAVIDVGGFLGIGEKPVALEFDDLNVRTDENGTMTVMVSASQEQLDQAPTFEEQGQASVQ